MMKYIALSLILSGFFALRIPAQSFLKNGEIPGDLIITLKRAGRFEDYVITIQSNGDWSFKGIAGLPVQLSPAGNFSRGGKVAIKVNQTKAKLTKEALRALISEFDKIQFFKFGKDFPAEDETTLYSVTSQPTETISIRINGQTKEVSNYLGDFGKRAALLRDLAEKIRSAEIWNFRNSKIPEDLSIAYRVSYGEGSWRELTIKSDGGISEKSYSNFPSNPDTYKILQSLDKSKKSKLKNKLSKQELKQLLSEFEKIGFSAFRYTILDNSHGCTNENISTHGMTKHISIQINNRNMYASTDKDCNAKPGTAAAKFEYALARIEETLKNVKAAKIN
jgi:hypothetical protein